MGTLYWQLNDCWPVASWASIDYHGRWKACQYMAKQFYAPLLVSGVEDLQTGAVELHVTSDLLEPRAGELAWILSDVEGNTLAEGAETVEIAPHANALVATLELKTYLDTHGPRNLLLWLELTVDGESVSSNFVSFARPKHLELATDPGISTMVTVEANNVFHVGISADAPALWVWLELEGADARYSDNFFHLAPGSSVLVTVTPAQPMNGQTFTDALRIHSLVDTYATNT
jgi:beta-mannosidase